MVKESARKCSHCGNNGHNSRTCCNGKSVKLFGVDILAEKNGEDFMRKCKSMGNLLACHRETNAVDDGYLSDDPLHSRRGRGRKKGVPWTEDEHLAFLAGLERLGKGDWRGISKNHVRSRTPTQVASHAQKYFIRLTSGDKKKHRSSLFDMSIKRQGTHDSPPPPEVPPDKTTEILPQGYDSPVDANLNNLNLRKIQAISTSGEVASPLEVTPVVSIAASYGAPDFHQMPYMPMVGVPSIGQKISRANDIPTLSFLPVMNIPNHGYFYMPNSYGSFATCAPYMSQSPSGLLPQQLPQGASPAGPMNFSG